MRWMRSRPRLSLIVVFRLFAGLGLLLFLPVLILDPSVQSLLLVVFGALLVLISFGFALGQRVERRASQQRRRQLIDTLLVWLLVATAVGLALVETNARQQKIWVAFAIAALCLEALYRFIANRLPAVDKTEEREDDE